jgi:hypothetical protein
MKHTACSETGMTTATTKREGKRATTDKGREKGNKKEISFQ